MVEPSDALAGRATPLPVRDEHFVNGHPLKAPFPEGFQQAVFGFGCFWGAERKFWTEPGVWTTAVGYAGGFTPNPTYEEVCGGRTGHAEVVLVVWDPAVTSYENLLKIFWEAHDPTQGMRQGNDVGTQYRSVILVTDRSQLDTATDSLASYNSALADAGYPSITTEIAYLGADGFNYAEDYHQQYLAKNPNGYCGIGGTGIVCPIGADNDISKGTG
jgi:peptide-methionine (S)-S-oxide reductase